MRWFRLAMVFACAAAPRPATGQDQFFKAGEVTLRYVEAGSGPPVILLHGLGGTLEDWWSIGVAQDLNKNFHVVAMDSRGHGKSGKPHEIGSYGDEMALDVVRLLDHLGIVRAHIVGYSMGALITSELLTLHPERFLTATLGAAGARFSWTEEDIRAAEQEASERETDCVSRTLIERLAPPDLPKPTDQELRARSEACFANPNQDRFAMAALTRARGEHLITREAASSVTVPTLAVVGTRDANLQALRELKQLRPDIELLVIEGGTHSGREGALTRPEFLQALRRLLTAK